MKKLLITLVLVGFSLESYSQTLIQTFTDRCTGVTQVFQISMTGTTTVVFYDRAKTFTASDVQSGAFQAWLEETYLWWSNLNPCSANQATTTTTQQTTQQTTSAATTAATNAASTPPPTTDATSTQNTAPTTSTSDSGSTSADTSSTDTSSTDSTQSTETDSSSSDSTGESGGSTEDSSEGSTEETSSEETSSEESSDSESEESVEEESSESEEESSEESSEDSEDNEEEEKKEEKKKNLAPPILSSNLATMQMLDGTWSTAASFGLSQSSLTGQETYSANLMLWSNFKQFSLGLGKSKIHFWSEYEDMAWTVSPITGKRTPAINYFTKKRYVDRQNQIHHIGSLSFNYMYLFGTSVITGGYSHVILGQNENFWKGFAGGYAATASFIFLPESLMLSPALTFFGTKPLSFKSLPRWSFAPMVATSFTPIQLFYQEKQLTTLWNQHFTYILGVSTNFNLTQRFVANLGINTINNTNPIIPTTFAITIGARFSF